MRRILLVAACLMLLGTAARAETMGQLYQKAKGEGALLFYSGGPVEPYERWAKEFMEKFPGITVKVEGGFSNVLDSKINQQIAAKKMEVDMALLQTVQDYVGWKKAGALIRFRPDGVDHYDARFRDKDEMFWATSVVLLSYAYNTNALKPNEVPKSALDFLKPQFAGKIVTAYPADDDATLFVFNDIVKKYGWGYMKKYMANKPNFIQGHLGELKSIADGTNIVTFDATNSTTGALKKAGQPIEFAFPTSDVMPTFFITAGIFKGAPHPNAAKLFLTWYLAKDQQARTGSFSARTDVPPPAGLKPLSSYKIDTGYQKLVTDRNIAALRKKFESYTGPVVNKGGVR